MSYSTVRSLFGAVLFACLFLGSIQKTNAVAVSIPTYPSIITDDSFVITASISGATNGTNYLRIDIFKDGTTNYFGETFNGFDWYGGSTFSQYLPVTIQSGAWQGSLQGRIGSPTIGQYDGEGAYKIRLRRYTNGGGNTASEANSSAVAISIVLPTATPTPTDVPTSTPVPTAAAVKTPTPTPSKNPTPTLKANPTATSSSETLISSESADILGASESANDIKFKDEKVASIKTKNSGINISLVVGVVLLSACGILLFRQIKG